MSKNKSTTVKKYSKLLEKDEDYDWMFLLKLEQFKLKRMKDYFIKSDLVTDNDIIIRDISLCIKLISIILEEDNKNFISYINFKNISRFTSKNLHKEWFIQFPEELRIRKALYLYNLIRYYKIMSWWD